MTNARKPAARVGALVLAACVSAVLVGARSAAARGGITVQRAPSASDTVLSATLSGADEVPGPGDEKGSGTFHATMNPAQNQVCYDITTTGLTDVTAAHIHEGDAGKSGPPVLPLKVSADGSGKECATVKADVITGMITSPSHYYVNVHDKAHPAGAIRGQLALATGM